MLYSFKSALLKEGNRVYLSIPFNVWETCGQKGLVPVEVEISGNIFECKLVPKGNGRYLIPVTKQVYKNIINPLEEIDAQFKLIDGLSRINSNSPYTKENPIRKIDGINYIQQPQNGFCGQACLAMLAGISINEVIKIMKSTKWQVSLSKVIETLDYFGFSYGRPIYTRGKMVKLPSCCILNVRGCKKSHLLIHYNGEYYDPTFGILQDYQFENIISYLEINT